MCYIVILGIAVIYVLAYYYAKHYVKKQCHEIDKNLKENNDTDTSTNIPDVSVNVPDTSVEPEIPDDLSTDIPEPPSINDSSVDIEEPSDIKPEPPVDSSIDIIIDSSTNSDDNDLPYKPVFMTTEDEKA